MIDVALLKRATADSVRIDLGHHLAEFGKEGGNFVAHGPICSVEEEQVFSRNPQNFSNLAGFAFTNRVAMSPTEEDLIT